jgi:hypothetical protein
MTNCGQGFAAQLVKRSTNADATLVSWLPPSPLPFTMYLYHVCTPQLVLHKLETTSGVCGTVQPTA